MERTAQQIADRVHRIMAIVESKDEYVELCFNGYAEPGYSDPDSGIIAFANWNPRSFKETATKADKFMPRICALFEKLGVEIEWSDEWYTCGQCGKAVRNTGNSYHWQPSYWYNDGEVTCHECIQDDPTGYLEHLEGNDAHCMTLHLDLDKCGYHLLENDFANGFYGGQKADPKVIGQSLRNMGINRYLFKLDDTGQFDIHFSVWIRKGEEWRKMSRKLAKWRDAKKESTTDPADMLKRQLQQASVVMKKQQG